MEQGNVIHDTYEDDSIDLTELFAVLWRGKILIVFITLLFLIISVIGTKIYNNKNAQLTTVISLQWDGIIDGEYPNGQLFNYKNMFEVHVLNAALDEAELTKVSASDLRENLVISGIVPNDTVALIEQSLKNGEKMTYYPTDFKLSLNFGALEITEKQGKILYQKIIENFRVDFEQSYINKSAIVELSSDELDAYDYADMYDVLSAQLNLINNTINRTLPESSNFTSSSAYGFEDLLVFSTRIQNTLMQDMLSGLETQDYIISKNPDLAKDRYENQISVLENSLLEKNTIKTELTALIDTYKGGDHVIIIPGSTPDQEFETNPYLSTLYQKLVNNEYEIASISAKIDLLQSRIDKLPTEAELSSTSYQERISFIEAKLVQTVTELSDLTNDTNTVLEEYNTLKIKNTLRTLTVSNVEVPQNMKLVAAICFVLGGMISVGYVIIRHSYKENKQKQNVKES